MIWLASASFRADHFRYAAQDRRLPAKHFRFVEQIEHVADRENRRIYPASTTKG